MFRYVPLMPERILREAAAAALLSTGHRIESAYFAKLIEKGKNDFNLMSIRGCRQKSTPKGDGRAI